MNAKDVLLLTNQIDKWQPGNCTCGTNLNLEEICLEGDQFADQCAVFLQYKNNCMSSTFIIAVDAIRTCSLESYFSRRPFESKMGTFRW